MTPPGCGGCSAATSRGGCPCWGGCHRGGAAAPGGGRRHLPGTRARRVRAVQLDPAQCGAAGPPGDGRAAGGHGLGRRHRLTGQSALNGATASSSPSFASLSTTDESPPGLTHELSTIVTVGPDTALAYSAPDNFSGPPG